MKYFFIFLFSIILYSCKVTAQITQKQINVFLNDTAVRSGHVGISIYEPATQKYLYNYNAEKNFTPSSNVKLFTLYAGMKYLGDSLVAAKISERNDTVFFQPTGDPTFLHKDFSFQPLYDVLNNSKKGLVHVITFKDHYSKFGSGWNWDDYEEDYMAERSRFSIYGNVFSFFKDKNLIQSIPSIMKPPYFEDSLIKYFAVTNHNHFKISRLQDFNKFFISSNKEDFKFQQIPFKTHADIYTWGLQIALLAEKLKINKDSIGERFVDDFKWTKIHSQPTDSLFRPMMHNSDNFFAEQTLLMVSNEKLGYMSDEDIIDTLLKTDFKDLPTKPRWVDGSGLSRYNLFSPKDFVFILEKMKIEFGMERLNGILTTGGQGTLKAYYDNSVGFIYAKTGSMSNNVSLSGYLFTKKNKMLIFSVQINGFSGTGRAGRRAIEKMLQQIRENN
jgi:serine-type D-Ala-D-Ala carboxypeptidase/endopeptidase (penicillin-binding protein 4)